MDLKMRGYLTFNSHMNTLKKSCVEPKVNIYTEEFF